MSDACVLPREGNCFRPVELVERFFREVKVKIPYLGVALMEIPILTASRKVTPRLCLKLLDTLQPGDIVLSTDNLYPGWQIFEKILGNSDYTHVGIYEGRGRILEARSGHGVIRNYLRRCLKGYQSIKVVRPAYKSPDDVKAMLLYAKKQLGKDYDVTFDSRTDDRIYCSELVAKSLERADPDLAVRPQVIFGIPAYLPGDMKNGAGTKVIFDDKTSFAKNLLSHYPGFIGGAAIGITASAVFGKRGGWLGFIGGAVATMIVGGILQKRSARL